MSRSNRFALGIVALFTALVPLVASAQVESSIQTPDEVRAKFTNAGFQVDAPTTWWTNGSTTFLVHDAAGSPATDGRVLMVFVYPDMTTAQAERDRASKGEAATDDASGPRLAPAYGPSEWQGNVAIVETTWSDLNSQYEAEIDADLGTSIAIGQAQPDLPRVALGVNVDDDFLAAIQQPIVNL